MKSKNDLIELLQASHYLKSSLATVNTISETISLVKDENKLSKILRLSVKKLDFRLELFLNYLLASDQLWQIQLEFFDLKKVLDEVIKSGSFKAEKLFFGSESSILADKKLVRLCLQYCLYLAEKRSLQGKIIVSFKKRQKEFSLETSSKIGLNKSKNKKTDQEFENTMLSFVVKQLAKQQKGKFTEKFETNFYSSRLLLPERFTP